jgi:hypothetical protein
MGKVNPDFVIAGAPKCGTTSLYRYLQQHPRVYMPELKEPRFFCNFPVESFEFGTKQFHPEIVTTPDKYVDLFAAAPADSVTGEASTDYLWVEGTAARIRTWNPAAKIIVMLRNPIDRAYSEYRHTIAANFQQETFWSSLQKENERFRERFDPIFFHVRRGLYAQSLKSYFDTFGRNQVMVVLYEDFAASPKDVVQRAFAFLGLAPCPIDVSQRFNADDEARGGARGELSPEQFDCLRDKFRADAREVETLLKHNLDHWLTS